LQVLGDAYIAEVIPIEGAAPLDVPPPSPQPSPPASGGEGARRPAAFLPSPPASGGEGQGVRGVVPATRPAPLANLGEAGPRTASDHALVGELVLTNLGRIGSPLIRYRCGRGW